MKNFKKYLAIIILLSILILPTQVFAAWWNPLTWNWNVFNIFKIFKKPVQTQTAEEKTNLKEDDYKKDNIKNDILSNIIYPNGGEVLEIGKTYKIKWGTEGYSKNSKVSIWLVSDEIKKIKSNKEREYYESFIASTKNTGTYDWTISSKMDILVNFAEVGELTQNPLYKNHKIKILIEEGSNEKIYLSKDYFRIASTHKECTPSWRCSSWGPCTNNYQSRRCVDDKNCGLALNMPSIYQECEQANYTNAFIKVISPNGGEKFVLKKQTYPEDRVRTEVKVSWESKEIRKDAWGVLYLISQDRTYSRDILNNGFYDDYFYGESPPGKYKVKVTINGDDGKQYSDESDGYFDIVSE